MISDLKYALRRLLKAPGFTAIAVLILALGIASNTSVFTVIDALLLRGLPVSHPEELVLLSSKFNGNLLDRFSYPVFEQFRTHTQSLTGVTAFTSAQRSMVISGSGRNDPIPVKTAGVSGDFFPVLGRFAFLGRTLTPIDDRADAPRAVIVISYAFWQRQFGADPDVLGKTVLIDNTQFAIVGVTAPGFTGVEIGNPTDLWLPLQMYPIIDPGSRGRLAGPRAARGWWLLILGRLRPGMTSESAKAELNVLFTRELDSDGAQKAFQSVHTAIGKIALQPGGSGYVQNRVSTASLLNILMIVVGMVLAVACANVASLLLARTAVRQRELAVRTALGAGRGRLIRQMMVESLLLAAAGGVLGLLLTHWGTHILAGYLPGLASIDLSADIRVLSFVVAASAATGILIGLLPAIRFSRLNLVGALKAQASTVAGGSGQRLGSFLVAGQIALSVCLLAGAGLFVRTLENLKSIDGLGFNRRNVLIAYLAFDKNDTPAHKAILAKDVIAATTALPGVRSSTFLTQGGTMLAGNGNVSGTSVSVEGYVPTGDNRIIADNANIGPRFFATMGMALAKGRDFELADAFPNADPTAANAVQTIIINEAMARQYFGERDPLGRKIIIPDQQEALDNHVKQTTFKIVGVVKNTKHINPRKDDFLEIYLPAFAQLPSMGTPAGMTLELRAWDSPLALVPQLRTAIHAIDPKLGDINYITTLDEVVDRTVAQEQMIAHTATSFSLFALLLASLGLYGVLAYNVAQRTREIGVRIALGAQPGNIISLVLHQGMGLTLIGCVAGTAAAMALAHLIASRLYGIPALDPLTFLSIAVVLLTVALIACWLPARRATKVDPMVALRAE